MASKNSSPLADRMRPKTLEEFFGQEKIIGPGKLLRQAIASDAVPPMIFWGPPGSGKTTLAYIIANSTNSDFVQISAVSSGVADLRQVIIRAEQNKKINKRDRLELEDIKFHKKVREGYLKLAAMEPERIKLIKAPKGINEIHREIVRIVNKVLK